MADEKEKYYFAKPVDSDWYDWEHYYSEEDAEEDLFWAGGNRDFKDFNAQLISGIDAALNNAYTDIADTYFAEDDEGNVDEEEVARNTISTIRSYFRKPDGSPLKNSEVNKLGAIIYKYNEDVTSGDEELDCICDVLEIYYGKPFDVGVLRGNSPSDWMSCIYPRDLEDKIPYIEAVLMGTGTEYAITTEKLEQLEGDIMNEDVYYAYTELWKDSDVIDWLAKTVIRCSPSEIKLLELR